MEVVALTSKQIRRARIRAALKEKKEAAGDSSQPRAEGKETKAPAQPKVENVAKASTVTAARVLVPKKKVKAKKVREHSNEDDGDLIAEVETPLDRDSVMDADFMAEIAALARECAENNPFDVENSESEQSDSEGSEECDVEEAEEEEEEEEVKPSKKSVTNNKALSLAEETKKVEKVKKNDATASKASVPLEEHSVKSKKEEQTINQAKNSGKDKNSGWNFDVDYNDHFETPPVAYSDIVPMLKELATSLGKLPEDLIIYDPYYCQGAMVRILAELGFTKVVNRNRDFYTDIASGAIPYYDILLTNPPYSGDHKTLLLKYLLTSSLKKSETASDKNVFYGKPFALLLPAYTATKSYWREFVTEMETKTDYKDVNKGGDGEKAVLYVLPPDSYEYQHPEGTGKGTPPFFSAWFLGGFRSKIRENKNEIVSGKGGKGGKEEKNEGKKGGKEEKDKGGKKGVEEGGLTGRIQKALMVRQTDKISRIPRILRVMSTVDELVCAKIVTDKRPSSKKRKKLMGKRGFSVASSSTSTSTSSGPTVFKFSLSDNGNNDSVETHTKKKTKL